MDVPATRGRCTTAAPAQYRPPFPETRDDQSQ
jgi:hypothetical protein